MMNKYDDEIRLFLMSCLKKVSYLKDISDAILTHLALNMVAQDTDKGTLLNDATSIMTSEFSQQMIIIYRGKLSITAMFDGGDHELPIEYIKKGTILNA